jgi:hypothetical protein
MSTHRNTENRGDHISHLIISGENGSQKQVSERQDGSPWNTDHTAEGPV